MGEDDLFDIFPDMDLDGDKDLVDALILEDILLEEERLTTRRSASTRFSFNVLSSDEEDIFIEYGIDPDDYITREDYLEAVYEAKYGWRETVEWGFEYGIDPEDFETEDEYTEAFEEAQEKYGWRIYATGGFEYGISAMDFETEDDYYAAVDEARNAWKSEVEDGSEYYLDPEDYETKEEYIDALVEAKYGWRKDAEDGSDYGLTPDAFETAEEYEDALIEFKKRFELLGLDIALASAANAPTSNSDNDKNPNYSYIQIRKNNAKIELKRADQGEFYGEEKELERCKFIVTSKSIAARYLTTEGVYLYAQAIKDHFKLPFEIADEKDEIETYFETLLQDLVEDNAEYAMEIWEWCIDTFLPYIQYADYKNDLTHGILLDIGNFIEEFPSIIVAHMIENPTFIEKLILGCTDSLWCIEDFVVLSLKGGHVEIAKKIMECAFSNSNSDIGDKARFVKSCIDECSNWEELETMELFQKHIFPIVFNESDVRIKNKIPRWQKDMREYIESVERDCDKYEFSRIYAWRAKYQDSEISPIHYDNEKEYLEAVDERRYGWRKYCTNRFGIDPTDYETRAEYDAAIGLEYERERKLRERERAADPRNTTLYKFCKVSINFPEKPYYYYLTGNLEVKTGDRVIVPFGKDNVLIEAVVMSVGECFGSAFPCHIDLLKNVTELVQKQN